MRTYLLAAAMACLCAGVCEGAMVTLNVNGTVDQTDFATVALGTPFHGVLTYDTTALLGGDAVMKQYLNLIPMRISFGVSEMQSGVGEQLLVFNDLDSSPAPNQDKMNWAGVAESITGPLSGQIPPVQFPSTLFMRVAFNYSGSPGPLNSSDAPSVMPSFGLWDYARFTFEVSAGPDLPAPLFIGGYIEDVEAVPEPETYATALMGLGILAWRRAHVTERRRLGSSPRCFACRQW